MTDGEGSVPKMIAEAMMSLAANLEPVFEYAKGLRDRLEAEGWSSEVAEATAAQVMSRMLTIVTTPAAPPSTPGVR